jgi:hypothetical protein
MHHTLTVHPNADIRTYTQYTTHIRHTPTAHPGPDALITRHNADISTMHHSVDIHAYVCTHGTTHSYVDTPVAHANVGTPKHITDQTNPTGRTYVHPCLYCQGGEYHRHVASRRLNRNMKPQYTVKTSMQFNR